MIPKKIHRLTNLRFNLIWIPIFPFQWVFGISRKIGGGVENPPLRGGENHVFGIIAYNPPETPPERGVGVTKWLVGVERGALNPGSGGVGATMSHHPPSHGG